MAALNSHAADIRWIEQALEIDGTTQRMARTGTEIYQTLMRLSIREPTATDDITLVVMDQDVAEWLVQWFSPEEQVEVYQIDTGGALKKGKPGRPMIGDRPMTPAERKRRERERRRLASQNVLEHSSGIS